MSAPGYMAKHPCSGCGAGYIECLQGARLDLKCCADCEHPTRWSDPEPYTAGEVAAMRADRA